LHDTLEVDLTSVDGGGFVHAPNCCTFNRGGSRQRDFVSAACSEERDLAMIYSPEGGSLQLNVGFLSREVTMQCFNPETGKLLWQRHFDENEKRSEENN